jgi:hypothetical protein
MFGLDRSRGPLRGSIEHLVASTRLFSVDDNRPPF